MRFAHLHVHTDYSFLDGVGRSDEYAEIAAENGHTALAITDHGNLYGLPSHRRACKKAGIKPIYGCMLAGQEILTARGVVPVDQIRKGDLVLTAKGRFRKVTRTMSRVHRGSLYEFSLAGAGKRRRMMLTGEHPVMVRDERGRVGWIDAAMVPFGRRTTKRGVAAWSGYACQPKLEGGSGELDLRQHLPREFIVHKTGTVQKVLLSKGECDRQWDLSAARVIDDDFAYFLGLFAAEGSVRHVKGRVAGVISLCFNWREMYPDWVVSFLRRRFGIAAKSHYRKAKGTCEVVFCCVPMAHVLKSMFGHGAANKRVPREIFESPPASRRRFLEGLWDGDASASRAKQRILKVASRSLAWGARALLADIGAWSDVGSWVGEASNMHYSVGWAESRAYSRTLQDDRFCYRPIREVREIRDQVVRVYNFAVEEDESYVTDCVLHNCEFYVNDERHRSKEVYSAAREESIDRKTLDPTFTDAHLVLLCQSQQGWQNLLKINHDSVLNGYYYKPRTTHAYVCQHADGLIATTACINSTFGKLAQARDRKRLRALLGQFKDAFGDRFFYEVHVNNMPEQEKVNQMLRAECGMMGIRPLLTQDVHYACQGDDHRQDEMIATSRRTKVDDPDAFKLTVRDLWMTSVKDAMLMARKYGMSLDKTFMVDAAINTADLADSCEADIYGDGTLKPPQYVDDQGVRPDDPFETLKQIAVAGFKKLVRGQVDDIEKYKARFLHELRIIKLLGMTDFYLVTWDITQQCAARRIFVWTRGSGCASLVAACMGITPLDPVRFGLLFERFVDPSRPNAPDFDLDIDSRRRYEIIQWLEGKYGGAEGERIARICSVQTFGLKGAIRDVLKCRGVNERIVNTLARVSDDMEPAVGQAATQAEIDLGNATVANRGEVIAKAIAELREVAPDDMQSWIDANGELLAGACAMVGRVKNRGLHAAGYVVSPEPLRDIMPVDRALEPKTKRPIVITAWTEGQASQDIADTGLMKIDLLGLETLAVVSLAIEQVKVRHGRDIFQDLNAWKMDFKDQKVLREFRTGNGFGLHQLGEMNQSLAAFVKRLKPKAVTDIIAAVAVYRPGAMEHMGEFVDRAAGQEQTPEVHPIYDEITKDTYGILVYQEQVMLLLNLLGGIALRDAYKIIKAISKKKKDEIEKARKQFVAGASTKIAASEAEALFENVMAFAGYGFNKAHAASYGVLSWVTAYLRAYYPLEFWWAWLCCTDNEPVKAGSDERKVEVMMRKVRLSGVKIRAPLIGVSGGQWVIDTDGSLIAPLSLIKGMGENAANEVLAAATKEKWADVWAFLTWAESHGRAVNAKTLAQLARAGAMRRMCKTNLAVDITAAFAVSKKKKSQTRTEAARHLIENFPNRFCLTLADFNTYAVFEKVAFGFTFWRDAWAHNNRAAKAQRLEDEDRIASETDDHLQGKRRAYLLSGMRKFKDRKGNEMAFLSLNSRNGRTVKGIAFSRTWPHIKDVVRTDRVYLVRGNFDREGGYLIDKGERPFVDIDDVECGA